MNKGLLVNDYCGPTVTAAAAQAPTKDELIARRDIIRARYDHCSTQGDP